MAIHSTNKDAFYNGFYYAEKVEDKEERVRLKTFIIALNKEAAEHAANEYVRVWNTQGKAEHRFVAIVAEVKHDK